MGFTKDDSSTGESLFIHTRDLFRVDPTTRDVSLVGRTSIPDLAELTGTGDGKLFGYTPNNGVIARFDKTPARPSKPIVRPPPFGELRVRAMGRRLLDFIGWGRAAAGVDRLPLLAGNG